MINLIRGPPKNPERKIEARASNCADTVYQLDWIEIVDFLLIAKFLAIPDNYDSLF